jgi:hypothetical protein
MTDRAGLLARIADDFMENGGSIPSRLPPACTGFHASLWPEAPADPYEIRFSAAWPGIVLVCSRPLAGYSLEGGLHRE